MCTQVALSKYVLTREQDKKIIIRIKILGVDTQKEGLLSYMVTPVLIF